MVWTQPPQSAPGSLAHLPNLQPQGTSVMHRQRQGGIHRDTGAAGTSAWSPVHLGLSPGCTAHCLLYGPQFPHASNGSPISTSPPQGCSVVPRGSILSHYFFQVITTVSNTREHLKCARNCSEHFADTASLYPPKDEWGRELQRVRDLPKVPGY